MIFTELPDKQPFNFLQETVTVKIEKKNILTRLICIYEVIKGYRDEKL